MIKSIKNRSLRKLFDDENARFIDPNLVKRIKYLLEVLDTAVSLEELNFPGGFLHELKGERKGIWSLRVSANWRITFYFEDGHAYNVGLEDYH
jgi:proteic killer suppression protein